MRVLVFTSLFPNNVLPHHGVFIRERMQRVAALQGIELRVVAPVPWFPPIKLGFRWRYSQVLPSETIGGLAVTHPRYFLVPKISTRWHGAMMARALLAHLRSLRASFPFEIIDAHFVYPDGYAAVEMGRALGVPVVVSARGSDINVFREMPAIRPLLRRTIHGAAGLIAVSDSLAAGLRELGASPEKITVIPNGVDSETFHPVPRAEARARIGVPEGRLLVSVGHLTWNKGFDRLLRAVRVLLNEGGFEDLRVAIVGEGAYRRDLTGLIGFLGLAERVTLTGDVPHRDLPDWYAAADLSCLFSRKEGWPNVVLESLACGTPVIATPVGGIPDALATESVGALAEGDDQALAAALRSALAKRWDRGAIARYAAGHSWERAAEGVRDVLVKTQTRGTSRRDADVAANPTVP